MEGLTASEKQWIDKLKDDKYNQSHIIDQFIKLEAKTSDIQRFIKQVEEIDKSYPGGLLNYLERARKLLADLKAGANPFEGYTPSVPLGECLTAGSQQFSDYELIGLKELGLVCFVLVAGGLGERLGYPDIKIGLPCETTTEMTYIELYIRTILATEAYVLGTTGTRPKLPLAIMTSLDTKARTEKLLKENKNFGLPDDQLTIMEQKKIPGLIDNDARMAMKASDPFEIETKPHGHGDVHTLLNQHHLPAKWIKEGKKWVIFFQDTNGLVFHSLPVVLGVSKKLGLAMNSITVPRKPGEAVGAICKLNKDDGTSLTINVEYNQLGPLLSSCGEKKGDVGDPISGNSIYPGNINVIVFNLDRYCEALTATGGAIPEFVNPKFKDGSKDVFKSATRLECMMQEFPRLFSQEDKVGFTQLERWLCFSTVKNNTEDAVAKTKNGLLPESPFSGEADQYFASAKLLEIAAKAKGCETEFGEPEETMFLGINYKLGPRVVLYPSFGYCLEQIKQRIHGGVIKLSSRSTLVVDGDVEFDGLELDGTLILRADPGKKLPIKDLKIENKGWEVIALKSDDKVSFPIEVRGYKIQKHEQTELLGS